MSDQEKDDDLKISAMALEIERIIGDTKTEDEADDAIHLIRAAANRIIRKYDWEPPKIRCFLGACYGYCGNYE